MQVRVIQADAEIQKGIDRNLHHALNTALLLLPHTFSLEQLFVSIAGLSYLGDFRMSFGENPRKVHNIVAGNMAGFVELYGPLMDRHPMLSFQRAQLLDPVGIAPPARESLPRRLLRAVRPPSGGGPLPEQEAGRLIRQDMSEAARVQLLRELPVGLRERLDHVVGVPSSEVVRAAVASIVGPPARTQSLKGILTGGVVKSVKYAWEKVKKMQAGRAAVLAAAPSASSVSQDRSHV